MNNAVQKYKVFNPEDENCPVCAGVNSIYRADSFQQEIKIPDEIGKGYYRHMIVKPSMEIFISDVTFYESRTMRGSRVNLLYGLAFCVGGTHLWRVEGNKQEYEMVCGESYIFNRFQGDGVLYRYNAGQRFLGLRVEFDAGTITSLIQYLGKERSCAGLFHGSGMLYKREFSSAIRLLLNDMIHCPYRDDVKRIYLEGKMLELIAVYLHESILENGGSYSPGRLSITDIKSLHEARRVLDENITSPPTISKLAKLVYLNVNKLKTGFKELFGMPVHAYIIDKRLEMARFLLEEKKLKVMEAVLLVGYSDNSHFAAKFRKKYGVNPSEYS